MGATGVTHCEPLLRSVSSDRRGISDSTMSFNYYARKVRDPGRPIWQRWSSLHACLSYVAAGAAFGSRRNRWVEAWRIGPDRPPTEDQLLSALRRIEVERNQRLEKLRQFQIRRIREKMRGRWNVPAAERRAVWAPLNKAWQAEEASGAEESVG
jgi:hypothetical protein